MRFKATLIIILVAASFHSFAHAAELGNVQFSDVSEKATSILRQIIEQFQTTGSSLKLRANEGAENTIQGKGVQGAEKVSKKILARLLDRDIAETIWNVGRKIIAAGGAFFDFIKDSFVSLWTFVQKIIEIFKK